MPPAEFAKSAKSRHLKRVWRDAQSAQALQDAARSGGLESGLVAVVIEDEIRWKARKLLAKTSPWKARGAIYSVTHWPKPHPRWFERAHPPIKAHRTSAPWRDITDTFKAHWAHLALSLEGDFRAFTLNLGESVEAKAFVKGKAAKRWLVDELNRRLKPALGRPVLYWFRLEMSKGKSPYLHLHGEIACASGEVRQVREALRLAAGVWGGRKQDQVHTCNESPDLGWVSYVMKFDHAAVSSALARVSGKPHAPSWRDDRFFISQELSRNAKDLHEGLRNRLSIKPAPLALAA